MKAMSRFTRVFWLLSAAVLLLLINLQTAAQPDAPPPIDEILAQPVAPPPPQAMSYQPPAETSLVADLMPPQTVLVQPNITVPEVDSFDPGSMLTLNSPAQTIPLPLATDTAVSLIDERLTLVVEQDTFDAPVNLAVRSLAVLPVPDETAETSDEPAAYDAAPFMRFALDMLDEKGQPIESFAKNVRLVVDVRDYGIDKAEEGGEFYLAYENPQQPGEWLETSLTAHDSHGLISAEVSHFSNWEAGWRPNGWTFQWQPPTPDPYTGAAVYSYPFNLPPGRNGLAPAVSLNYSSSGLRGFSNRGSGWGAVATAWNLSDISITRTKFDLDSYDAEFRLTLNGKGGRLIRGGNEAGGVRYYVEDQPGLRIMTYHGANYSTGVASFWVVTDENGTQYRLGYTPTANTRHTHKGPAPGDPDYSEGNIIGWHVDTITDRYGNQINYDYITHVRTTASNPLWLKTRTHNAELSQISYNFNNRITTPITEAVPRLNDNATAGTRIQFIYAESQLTAVEIYHGNQSHWLRRYALDATSLFIDNRNPATGGGSACHSLDNDGSWGGYTHMRTLNAVWEEGWDKTNNRTVSLPATRFSYTTLRHLYYNSTNCMLYKYLSGVENGYGGRVEFGYSSDGRGIWDNGHKYLKSAEQYVVNQTAQYDGRNPRMVTTYEYFDRCYDEGHTICKQPETDTEYGGIAGHGQVIITTKNFEGTPLLRQVLKFHHDLARQGKIEYQETGGFTNGSFVVAQRTDTTYNTNERFGNNVRFTYAQEVVSTQYHNGLNTPSLSTSTRYEYHTTLHSTIFQKNVADAPVQLGQPTHITEYRDGVPYRLTRNWYRLNDQNGGWLIRPTSSSLYDGDSWNLVSGTWNYYDGSSTPGVLPAAGKGDLTRVRQYWEIPCGEIPGGCNRAFQTIDATYAYDAYGNTKTSTSYQNYGYRAVNSSNAEIYNLFAEQAPGKIAQTTTIAYENGYNLYPVSVTNAAGQATTFEIYGFNGVPVDGFQTQPGLLKKVVDPNGLTTAYEYDPFGRLAVVYDRDLAGFGDTNRFNGFPAARYAYWDNNWNSGWQTTAPFVITTLMQPNAPDGKVRGELSVSYDGFGRPIQERDRNHEIDTGNGYLTGQDILTTTGYDALGRTTCSSSPFNKPYTESISVTYTCGQQTAVTTTTYDILGRPQVITAPDGTATKYYYAIRDRSRLENDINGDYTGTPDYRTGTGVMPAGPYAVTSIVDPNNHAVSQFYNALGQLVYVTEFSGTAYKYTRDATTTYGYDLMGNLVRVIDEQGNATTMTYDALERKTEMVDPDMGHWYYTYDAAGNLKEQFDANGKRLCFYYDNLNRITAKVQDSSPANPCPVTNSVTSGSTHLATYVYDTAVYGIGQLHQVKWGPNPAQNNDTFFYDSQGRMKKQTRLLDNRPYTMETTSFDVLNRPLTVKYPSEEIVTIGYDREGENSLKAGSDWLVSTVGYNKQGQIKRLVRNNGLTTWYGYSGYEAFGSNDIYDARNQSWNWTGQYGRLWRICTAPHNNPICQANNKDQSANGQVMDVRIGHDPAGNVVAVRDYLNDNQVQRFSYDHLNRLITASTEDANGSSLAAYNHSYTYNQIGNIASQTESVGRCISPPGPCQWGNTTSYNYTYSPTHVHAVDSAKGVSFTYDDNGNMTSRNTSGEAGEIVQEFDTENRLTSVTKVVNGQTTSFSYDAAGMRVKTVNPNGTIVYTPFPLYEEEFRLPPPTVTLTANGQSALPLLPNTSFTLAWDSDGADTCTASGSWSGGKAGNGTQSMSGFSSGARTYTLTCQNASGATAASVTVSITPLPTVNLSANGQTTLTLPAETLFILTWSSSGAQSCLAGGNWSGGQVLNGSQSFKGFSGGSRTYTLTCQNAVGSASQSVTVTIGAIIDPPPGPTAMNSDPLEGMIVTQRSNYTLAGQAIAVRVKSPGSNTLYYLHSDHLGSTSLATTTNGSVVPDSTARYTPFGDWRTEPTANLTDRGFTGHLHNNLGSGAEDIGLIYMQARWYLPALGRFISADTIVPNPTNPQSLNRYSYVRNSPLNMTDPTGHRECEFDGNCGPPVRLPKTTPPKPPKLSDVLDPVPQILDGLPIQGATWANGFGANGYAEAFPSKYTTNSAGLHPGMDFGKPFNPDCPSCNYVYSTVSGTISLTQFTGDSDPNVVIDVGNGLYVIYGDVIIDGGLRAAAIAAMEAGKDGFQVKPGDVIGSLVDQRTTDRDNTHVHLVVRQDQRIYNPAYFFKDPQILTKFTWGYAAGEDLYSMSSYVYGTNLNFWKDPTSVDLTRN